MDWVWREKYVKKRVTRKGEIMRKRGEGKKGRKEDSKRVEERRRGERGEE